MLLFFIEGASSGLKKLDLQKLLFLYTKEVHKPHYDFVPYKSGCYSFQCAKDLDLLEKNGWVKIEGNKLFLVPKNLNHEQWAVKNRERYDLKRWLNKNKRRGRALITETYRRYPYYAYYSQMKKRLLSRLERQAVQESVTKIIDRREIIFTLGYEGIHFETYLNKLIRNHVKALCDVRKNSISRKFGFSGQMLSNILPKFGIEYFHIPGLGINSTKRQKLNGRKDYKELFVEYQKSLLKNSEGLRQLIDVIQLHRRVALTCFEADPSLCHRHCVSEFVESNYGYRVKHL